MCCTIELSLTFLTNKKKIKKNIKWTLWILIYVVCTKFVFCRKLILKALFRFNGTSKPSLTIALKILKTIEKPLIPMVGP